MYEHEAPPQAGSSYCPGVDCGGTGSGVYDCWDCDTAGYYCQECILQQHRHLPFHRIAEWNNNCLVQRTLKDLGHIVYFGHGDKPCPYIDDELGVQDITLLDVTGVHTVQMGWCRCAGAPTQAEQLLGRKWFPATILRPRTAITFRVLKLFHLLNHIARTNPWDFAGTMHRLTDNVSPSSVTDIYKPFKHVKRQWRVIRAWKRGGVRDPNVPRESGGLAMGCVSCPKPASVMVEKVVQARPAVQTDLGLSGAV
ncbi:hypothetical protein M422DRAFT_186819 [Sphaerobolus stellatus SS14]|uniref:CxC2-like cysteine cluster KDZ transposase-associated domain-containing protein n=1 Tax=Sphaerobolus stellatus (strain SS14) TaxID=990650 RepID=A0A0C9TLD4_SPHS4|nr:hypothetical protein M422DRAFT_186819 [Sphaerobolus stellatus SS14]